MTGVSTALGKPVLQRWLQRAMGWRFVKFGTVGASGTVVNVLVLYLLQEHLLTFIASTELRLNLSLAGAILVATVNNFTWNRLWTWADRGEFFGARPLVQFGKYASACWLGILIQFLLTKLLAASMHYLLANVVAIVAASVFNFVINDFWTFEGLRLRSRLDGRDGRERSDP